MEAGEGPYGEAGPAARALLSERGLSEGVIGKAQEVLIRLKGFDRATNADDFVTPEERQATEDAMWAWYLEWSGIARRVVKDGNLLRRMGFKKHRGGSGIADEVIDETEEIEAAEAANTAEATGAVEATETANDVHASGSEAAAASSEEGNERAA